jgi:hypothetical protein
MGPPLRRRRGRSFYVGATFVAPQFRHEYIGAVTASRSLWTQCTLCHCTMLSNIYVYALYIGFLSMQTDLTVCLKTWSAIRLNWCWLRQDSHSSLHSPWDPRSQFLFSPRHVRVAKLGLRFVRIIYRFISDLTGNTSHLRYKAQPVNAVQGLLWELYGSHKHTLWAECSVLVC